MTLTDYAKEQGADVLVLTKPNCPQCEATKRRLRKKDTVFFEEPLSPQTIALAQEEGIASAPVVVVPGVGVWGGFQPQRLDEIK